LQQLETGGYLEDTGEKPLTTTGQDAGWAPTDGLRAVEKRKLFMHLLGIEP
jgi:hypothetical protein